MSLNRGSVQSIPAVEISVGNSTTTPLGGSGTFTGAWEDVSEALSVQVNVHTSHDTATNGVKFQWSFDGGTTVHEELLTQQGAENVVYRMPRLANFFRVVVVNFTTPQTSFIVETTYSGQEVPWGPTLHGDRAHWAAPLLIGGVNYANDRLYRWQVDSNGVGRVDTELAAAVAMGASMSNPTTAPVIAHLAMGGTGGLANPLSHHIRATAIGFAARTSDFLGGAITNINWRGAMLVLNVTAASGTGGLQPVIEAQDITTGGWDQVSTTPTAVTTTGRRIYIFHPDSQAGQGYHQEGVALPAVFRWRVIHGDSSSYTYEAGHHLLI